MLRAKFRDLMSFHTSMFAAILGSIAFLLAFLFNIWHCTVSSVIMIVCGIFLYLFFAKLNNDFFDTKAVFSGVWFCAIGLALLRLNSNQVPWENKTWICFLTAYISFLLGYSMLGKKKKKQSISTAVEVKEPTFFLIILVNFVTAIVAFIYEVAVIGFIPALTHDQAAYVSFYVKGVHYFTVSIVLFVPLSILYLKKFIRKSSKFKIALISICSIVALAIPVLIVSRQLCIMQTVLCLFAVYYGGKLNRKKILLMALIIALGVLNWVIISDLRNQNDEYLREVFDAPPVAQEIHEEKQPVERKFSSNVSQWPMTIYHPYMYISFNFDNFNYSVSQINRHSKGIYSLHPIVHMSPLIRLYNEYPMHVYNAIYNTYPIIYPPYYDFGIIGILIYMFFIGLLAKFSATWDKDNPFLQMIGYLIKFALMFSFFASFFANTAFMFYVVILLVMYFAARKIYELQERTK